MRATLAPDFTHFTRNLCGHSRTMRAHTRSAKVRLQFRADQSCSLTMAPCMQLCAGRSASEKRRRQLIRLAVHWADPNSAATSLFIIIIIHTHLQSIANGTTGRLDQPGAALVFLPTAAPHINYW